jgi:hypothetical protein
MLKLSENADVGLVLVTAGEKFSECEHTDMPFSEGYADVI